MISRIGWFANCGLAGCLLLADASWINGQQNEQSVPRGYRHAETDCEYGIEQAGFRNQPAGEPRYQAQAENGRHRARAENGTPLQGHRAQAENGTHLQGQRSSAVIGASVRLGDGNRVGRIEEIMIGESGSVDFMIVSFDGMTGLGGRLAAIPWSAGRMDFATRAVTLDIERERLYEAPIFFARNSRWPDLYESQWAGSVHTHFGIEANTERTIQRTYRTPAPKRSDDAQPDEKGARPRQPKDESRELSPTPAPSRKPQPGDAQQNNREERSTAQPVPRPAAETSSAKKDAEKRGDTPEKPEAKEKKPAETPENENKKPD